MTLVLASVIRSCCGTLLIETGEVEVAEFVEESAGVDEGGGLFGFRAVTTLPGEERAAAVFDQAYGIDVVLVGGGAAETPGVADDAARYRSARTCAQPV